MPALHLSHLPTLTEAAKMLAWQVVAGRCFSVLPIVEGLHDMGNLGAVCRSADGKPVDFVAI